MKYSVCIPTYNQSAYLEEAVWSAYTQSCPPAEIIVYDDCSTDATPAILAGLQAQIPTLRVVRQAVNQGISRNTDLCLRAARYELIIRLDSDDRLLPEFAETLGTAFQAYPQLGYAHAAVEEMDQYSQPLRIRRLNRPTGVQTAGQALKLAGQGYKVAANILMFRRQALQAAHFIASSVDFAEDYYLCASLAALGYANYYSSEVLSNYRVWTDQGHVRQRRKLAEIRGIRAVFEEVLQPAYQDRGWGLTSLHAQRRQHACQHADCLTWRTYTAVEKQELKDALLSLSSAGLTRLWIWLYQHEYGSWIQGYNRLQQVPRTWAKRLLLSWRSSFSLTKA
ncbi:glycosyltransferase family 2 protein [Siphonobacter curvatus]|uniref:Glycosyl transferase n=1 Tax=Siphonobacter curvatus TaxID=2094562 RepID=A0A2S7IF44_9BACT|nr:glycosyltransferase family 2 protein [Siphonobacter curvatus]PQA53171.1 glycosyl transferase [Siphonobacter curvatus]